MDALFYATDQINYVDEYISSVEGVMAAILKKDIHSRCLKSKRIVSYLLVDVRG